MTRSVPRAGRLFDRTRAGLVPTAAAEALRPHAESMAASARLAAAAVQGLEAEPEGVVRLAVAPGVDVDMIPPLLRWLKARPRHPSGGPVRQLRA